MSKGSVIVYDDDKGIVQQFTTLFAECGFDIIPFHDIAALRVALIDTRLMATIKAMVFDLAKGHDIGKGADGFEILEDIEDKFNHYRIPIFIHSAFASKVTRFDNCGTVWKIDKTGTSLDEITKIIESLEDSGFLAAFTPGGLIETSLMQELHKSFTEQFRKNEIQSFISAIKRAKPDNYRERSITIFKRIAVKSLMSDLLSPVRDSKDSVNPIEHFYRRIGSTKIWTGDIWIKNDKTEAVLILTPRCDLASGKAENLLICAVKPHNGSDFTGKKRAEQLRKHLEDNLQSKAQRYIPHTPFFDGGIVELSQHRTMPIGELVKGFTYQVTLSDDLINEILGKFAYYFLRTGINTMSVEEFDSYMALIDEAEMPVGPAN